MPNTSVLAKTMDQNKGVVPWFMTSMLKVSKNHMFVILKRQKYGLFFRDFFLSSIHYSATFSPHFHKHFILTDSFYRPSMGRIPRFHFLPLLFRIQHVSIYHGNYPLLRVFWPPPRWKLKPITFLRPEPTIMPDMP